MALTRITADGITDGSILNADINSSAAIALSKLSTSGTASNSTYLRGDGAWSTVTSVGGATGVDFNDNVKVRFGTGNDLEIYHDGTNNRLDFNSGTYNIFEGGNFIFRNVAGNEDYAKFFGDGGVELYYNAAKKLETTSTGIKVTGHYLADDNYILKMGTGADFQLFHDGSNSFINNTTGSTYITSPSGGSLFVRSDGFYVNNAGNSESIAAFNNNGAVRLYYDNSQKLETTSIGVSVTGQVHATSTIKVGDSVEFIGGDGNDLRLWHDGTNSYIRNYTGDLYIQGDGDDILMRAADDITLYTQTSDQAIVCVGDGGVELYHDNSKKFETNSDGAQVTGALKVKVAGSAYGDGLILEDENSTSQSELTHVDGVLYITSNPPGATHVTLDSSGNLAIPRDNAKFKVGASDDLQIYHTGSYSAIDNNTSHLYIRNNVDGDDGGDIFIQAKSGENSIICYDDGSTELYYDASKKLETTSSGIDLTGHLTLPDSKHIKLGNSSDFEIHHNTAQNWIENNGTFALGISVNNKGEYAAEFKANSSVDLYYDNSKKFETTSTGAKVNDWNLTVQAPGGHYARLHLIGNNASDNAQDFRLSSYGGYLKFEDYSSGAWQIGIQYVGNGSVNLYHANALKLTTTANGIEVHDLDDTTSQAKFISSGGTLGSVYGNSNDSTFGLLNTAGEWIVQGVNNGATNLYYDNSKKFETTSSGITINQAARFVGPAGAKECNWSNSTGVLNFQDNGKATFGTSNDLEIYHDGTNNHIKGLNGSTYIGAVGNVEIRNTDSAGSNAEWMGRFIEDGSVELYYDGTKRAYTYSEGLYIEQYLKSFSDINDSHWGTNNTYNWNLMQNNHAGSSCLILEHSHDSNPNGLYVFFSDGAPDNHTQWAFAFDDTAATRFMVWSDGDVRNHDNSYGSTSDIKLKENVVDASSQWDDVKAVKVRNFNFKTNKSKKLLGVVAQELETISPGLIDDDPEFDADKNPTGETTKSVKYSILYMKAFKALQEAMARIEALETQVAALGG